MAVASDWLRVHNLEQNHDWYLAEEFRGTKLQQSFSPSFINDVYLFWKKWSVENSIA